MAGTGDLQKRLAYEFNDIAHLTRALTHRSKDPDNNERLEFLGDSILGFLVAEWLYKRFPEAAEGKLSRMRSMIVRKETLAVAARNLQIQDALIMGEGELKSGGFNRDSILADAVEALIGAVYLDSGINESRQVVMAQFEKALNELTPNSVYKDPKSRLQEYLQQHSLPVPVYQIVGTEGQPHRQTFQVSCTIEGYDKPFVATGSSRRNAEQSAAEQAYARLILG
jgi:ribonuclease-3